MMKIENGRQFVSMEITEHFPKTEGQPWDTYFMRVWGQGKYATFDMPNISVDRQKLESFYRSLVGLHEALDGCLTQTFSRDLNFVVKMNFEKTGAVKVRAEIYDLPHCDDRCEIAFSTDQTFIAGALHQLEQMLYPES